MGAYLQSAHYPKIFPRHALKLLGCESSNCGLRTEIWMQWTQMSRFHTFLMMEAELASKMCFLTENVTTKDVQNM